MTLYCSCIPFRGEQDAFGLSKSSYQPCLMAWMKRLTASTLLFFTAAVVLTVLWCKQGPDTLPPPTQPPQPAELLSEGARTPLVYPRHLGLPCHEAWLVEVAVCTDPETGVSCETVQVRCFRVSADCNLSQPGLMAWLKRLMAQTFHFLTTAVLLTVLYCRQHTDE